MIAIIMILIYRLQINRTIDNNLHEIILNRKVDTMALIDGNTFRGLKFHYLHVLVQTFAFPSS